MAEYYKAQVQYKLIMQQRKNNLQTIQQITIRHPDRLRKALPIPILTVHNDSKYVQEHAKIQKLIYTRFKDRKKHNRVFNQAQCSEPPVSHLLNKVKQRTKTISDRCNFTSFRDSYNEVKISTSNKCFRQRFGYSMDQSFDQRKNSKPQDATERKVMRKPDLIAIKSNMRQIIKRKKMYSKLQYNRKFPLPGIVNLSQTFSCKRLQSQDNPLSRVSLNQYNKTNYQKDRFTSYKSLQTKPISQRREWQLQGWNPNKRYKGQQYEQDGDSILFQLQAIRL